MPTMVAVPTAMVAAAMATVSVTEELVHEGLPSLKARLRPTKEKQTPP